MRVCVTAADLCDRQHTHHTSTTEGIKTAWTVVHQTWVHVLVCFTWPGPTMCSHMAGTIMNPGSGNLVCQPCMGWKQQYVHACACHSWQAALQRVVPSGGCTEHRQGCKWYLAFYQPGVKANGGRGSWFALPIDRVVLQPAGCTLQLKQQLFMTAGARFGRGSWLRMAPSV